MMYMCPHCAYPTVSALRKLVLGPGRTWRCRSCRRYWGLPRWCLAVMIPTLVAFLMLLAPRFTMLRLGLFTAMAITNCFVYLRVVPVMRR